MNFKKCSCGITWTKLPVLKPWVSDNKIMGYFFNCVCDSTLFIAKNKLSKEALNELE